MRTIPKAARGLVGDANLLRSRLAWWLPWLALLQYENFLWASLYWLPALGQFGSWVLHPSIHGEWPALPGWPVALVGTGLLLLVGAFLSLALLPRGEFERAPAKLLAYSVLFGLSTAGWGAHVEAAIGVVSLPVLLAWVVLVGLTAGAFAYREYGSFGAVLKRVLAAALPYEVHPRPRLINWWILISSTAIGLLAAFHAFAHPITEWDAQIYHVGTASIWFLHRPVPPIIAGPSVGLEASYNYPSLFPGMSLFYFLLSGGPHDVYARLLPPVFGWATLVLIYFSARRLYVHQAGYFAVGLLAASPLFFMYTARPTLYAFLMLLITALLDCLVGAWETGKKAYVITAAILSGLVGATTYLSLPIFVFLAGWTLVFVRRWRVRVSSVSLAVALAIAVAGPTYVKNWIRLGDPVFPLGYVLFHSPYIADQSMLRDSIAHVTRAGLGHWGWDLDGYLLLAQIRTITFDQTLLPVGSLIAGILALVQAPAGGRSGLVIYIIWVTYWGVILLVLGSFFLSKLIPMLPALAAFSGVAFALSAEGITAYGRHAAALSARIVGTGARMILYGLFVAISVFPGLTLAWVGSSPANDYSQAWKHIGDDSSWLRLVFAGDYEAWKWLQARVGDGGRIATIENRWYYLGDYRKVLLLDGIEGAPLLRLGRPSQILRYMKERRVKYILAAAWADTGFARHPLVGRLPLYRYLGSSDFPLKAAFETAWTDHYTRIYTVGPQSSVPEIRVVRAVQQGATFRFKAGDNDGRIVATVPIQGAHSLEIEYLDDGVGPIHLDAISSWDPLTWTAFASLPRRGTHSWVSRKLVLAGPENVFVLRPSPYRVDAVIRRVSIDASP